MRDMEFPLFDGHMHFSQAYLDQVMASYDRYGVRAGVHFWGRDYRGGCDYHSDYGEFLTVLRERGLIDRFVPFYWPDWKAFGWEPEAFVPRLVADMRRYAAMGCRGLKVWKDVGMWIVRPDGRPATMDDPELDPVWQTAAELGWWVAIHQADPSRNWANRTRTGLSRPELWRRRDAVIAAHPGIRFYVCHNGNDYENVRDWAALLDRFPNVVTGMDRDPLAYSDSPEAVREFLETHSDRIVFGVDLSMPEERPPDDAWTLDNLYLPWRRRLVSFALSDEAFHRITWANGERYFLKTLPVAGNQ